MRFTLERGAPVAVPSRKLPRRLSHDAAGATEALGDVLRQRRFAATGLRCELLGALGQTLLRIARLTNGTPGAGLGFGATTLGLAIRPVHRFPERTAHLPVLANGIARV